MTTLQSDLICFSHLRWTFVFQRPQHLMSRFARNCRVYFFEEPIFEESQPYLKHFLCPTTGVRVITPVLPQATNRDSVSEILRGLLNKLVHEEKLRETIAWYYTPMALEFSDDLDAALTVYDCMDELSAFANAPQGMLNNEARLFEQCDLVFTGGASLFEVKRSKHASVHLFPSTVDMAHFSQALSHLPDPADQQDIARPRIGYVGVIDERMDLALLAHLADARPDWQVVLVGPVVKIDAGTLPRRANIYYLGRKVYSELPAYLSGWDVAILPFAQNDATRFISPTKTPEYLAAGLPVVSTPIRDVVRPYGESGLVVIGRDRDEFLRGVERILRDGTQPAWQSEVSAFLRTQSWDKTWLAMQRLIDGELARKKRLMIDRTQAAKTAFFTSPMSAAHV